MTLRSPAAFRRYCARAALTLGLAILGAGILGWAVDTIATGVIAASHTETRF